jgi:ADP-ribose pyrophosphatase YjhB (NUDIX family)
MSIPIGCVALVEQGNSDWYVGIQCKKGRGIILPGGKYDSNIDQTYHHTACRELREETGLVAEAKDLEYVWHGPDGFDHITFAFIVHKYSGKAIETPEGCPVKACWNDLMQSKFGGWYAVLRDVINGKCSCD